MGLNLWLDEYRNIEKYYLRRFDSRNIGSQIMIGDSDDVGPLFLNIDGVYKSDFTLDEIDSFTSVCKDLEDVRNNFHKFYGYEDVAARPGNLYIASGFDRIGKYQVIYDSPLLKECARVIREKRKKQLPEFLDKTPELEEYVQKIANYAASKDTGSSIRSFSLLPPHVKAVLGYYSESISDNQLDRAEKCYKNLLSFCTNYKTLRAFIIWEQEYLHKKEEQARIAANNRKSLKEEKASAYRTMAYEEELRRMPVEAPILEAIDSMRDENGNIDYDLVYSQFDVDDIYSNSDIALQAFGILPVETPKDNTGKRGSGKK